MRRWNKMIRAFALAVSASVMLGAAPGETRAASGVEVELGANGIEITAGSAGTFTLRHPHIEGDQKHEPVETTNHSPTHTTVAYAGGITAEIHRVGEHDIRIDLAGLPAGSEGVRMDMHVPFSMTQGGRYAIGDRPSTAFPSEKQETFLYQGSERSLTLHHPTGPGFTIHIPRYSFQQLQDNREWNWSIFAWFFRTPLLGSSTASFTLSIVDPPGGPAGSRPVVDRFGQWIDRDYPTKVRSEEELRRDLQDDETYYASLNPPPTDRYGGVPGTREKYGLTKTGFFHLGRVNGADVLVTPEGNAFFHLGVCAISPVDDYTLVKGREQIYEWLPAKDDPMFHAAWRPNDNTSFSFYLANVIRKTGRAHDLGEHVAKWIDRERKWGFTSVGAFAPTGPGPTRDQLVAKNYPYVAFLPLSHLAEIPGLNKVWDPFAEGVEEAIDKRFAESLSLYVNDPLVIGFYIVNEPSVEEAPKIVPKLKASESASKRRLTERLRQKYGDIAGFNRAWSAEAASFEQVGEMALTVATPEAAADVQAFFGEFLERRYSLVEKYFRKHDPNHLLIGDRWMPGTSNNELLVRTAGKYLDVISINYYTFGLDTRYLDRIHEWSGGRPILLSEFYFTSPEESGLQGGRRMRTQRERGLAYRHYVEHAAAIDYVVGVEWFLFIDQAATGRFFEKFNGEANNTGLVNVADRPYKGFLDEVVKTNYDIFSVLTGERERFRLDDPRFTFGEGETTRTVAIPRLVKPFVLDGNRSEWPMVPPDRVDPRGEQDFHGTFRLAWDDQNFYLYIEVADPTPMHNDQPGASIWNGDAVELFIGTDSFDERGTMLYSDRQVLIRGATTPDGLEPAFVVNGPEQHGIDAAVVRQVDGSGYFVEAAIPFQALGFEPRVHRELLFDLAIDDGAGEERFRQLVFNGTTHASKDRGVWGRAELLP